MKGIILFISILVSCSCIAQNDWTKDDRTTIYNEFLDVLSKYKMLTLEQKESIGLCSLESTTQKFTKKDMASKIEVELKRIYQSVLDQCAKNIGIELKNNEPENINIEIKESTEWTKEDKITLSKISNDFLSQYKHLTSEQKEILTLCFINEVTNSKTKKEYEKLIDLEVRQIKSSVISQCAKQNNISLADLEVKIEEKVVAEWVKEDKIKLVNEFNDHLKNYPNLTDDHRETLSLCFIDEITSMYKKAEYFEMIDMEHKKIKQTYLSKCAIHSKIDLTNKPEVIEIIEKKQSIKEVLVGSWKTDENSQYNFKSDGTFEKKYNSGFYTYRWTGIDDNIVRGNWFVDETNTLTLNESWTEIEYKIFFRDKRTNYVSTSKFKFTSSLNDYFKIEIIEGSSCCRKSEGNDVKIIQANKVK